VLFKKKITDNRFIDSIVVDNNNIEEKLDQLFHYYRTTGYPNYNPTEYDKYTELDRLIRFNENSILFDDNCLQQTMHSCGFLWTYFPHWNTIECGSSKSVIDCWNDDDKLKELLRKTYNWHLKHGNGKWTTNRIRQIAKVYGASQSVSNFRPTVAKFIYNTFGNSGIVWDMSSGFGGRLLGFLASNCKKYIGTDPSTKTYEGLQKLANDYKYVGKEIELYKLGSEEYRPEQNSLDLCFTSPPYFDTEKYSNEETQSYIKFPTIDSWLDGFLYKTIKNCYYGLKNNGYLIININNVKNINLNEPTKEIAIKLGFIYEREYKLVLSSIAGKGIKFEPVFVFRKCLTNSKNVI
jgi:tRNA1(Val) A37 N6-methylase TrmN6